MSLLWMDYEEEFQKLVDMAYVCEREARPDYFNGMSRKVQQIIYRDTRYNIDFLYTAYMLKDDKVMTDYSEWLLGLMHPILKKDSLQETAAYVIRHLESIREGVRRTVSEEKKASLVKLLDMAEDRIRRRAKAGPVPSRGASRYEAEIGHYMQSLMEKNSRKTLYLIKEFQEKQIPIKDIYVEIIAESMRRVGELWHTAKISVDTEHYCTSVTQMAMAQLYPELFDRKRRNRTLLCACPGTELHEMGARMVADLFENDGWDSIYLGAAVPEDAMMEAVRENQPDLIALSVTMPQHLMACRDLVERLRKEFPDTCIAVGGGAFRSTHEIWKQWPVDIYTEDARDLVKWADDRQGAERE